MTATPLHLALKIKCIKVKHVIASNMLLNYSSTSRLSERFECWRRAILFAAANTLTNDAFALAIVFVLRIFLGLQAAA